MVENLGKYIQRISAFGVIVLGAKMTSDGFAMLKSAAAAGKLAEGLAAAGLIYENRFEPHVTLGRVKAPLPENFIRRTSDFTSAKKAVSSLASVELMESVLTPEGPQYRQVYSKRL